MLIYWMQWLIMIFIAALQMALASAYRTLTDCQSFHAHQSSDKQILDGLLNESRYDRRVRPSDQTMVNVSVLLLSLASPDESSLKYDIEFLMHMKWHDPRLQFDDHGKHKYLNGMPHADLVWLPDTYFIKHGEFKSPLVPVHLALRIYSDGTVHYSMRRHMALNCQGNLKIFPFDNPKCPFAIEIISHEDTEVMMEWSQVEASLSPATNMRTHNAYLVKNETGICDSQHTWRGNYSCLRVLLVFTRDKSFYFSTVFVPGMVLVTSSFISFWLDINAVPARVMIGVTTMLNFCTTTNSFRSTLPVVSNLTAMNLWDGVCMFFIYASMLEFITVNYLFRKWPHGGHHRHSTAGQAEPSRSQSALLQPVGLSKKQTGDSHSSLSQEPQPPSPVEFASCENNQMNHRMNTGKARAAASVFAWLRRPQITYTDTTTSPERSRIPRAVDNISKLVFLLAFGGFTFGYFLTYAVIKPSHEENWNLSGYVSSL